MLQVDGYKAAVIAFIGHMLPTSGLRVEGEDHLGVDVAAAVVRELQRAGRAKLAPSGPICTTEEVPSARYGAPEDMAPMVKVMGALVDESGTENPMP